MNENLHKGMSALPEELHREETQRPSEARQTELGLVEKVHREAIEKFRKQPSPPPLPTPTIHYTELPDAKPDSPIYREWSFYRGEAGRLLAEGHEGRFVLIKGEQIIGIWDTGAEAKAVALQRYLMQPCLIQQVQRHARVVLLPPRLRECQG
jgi:hypothetical protein